MAAFGRQPEHSLERFTKVQTAAPVIINYIEKLEVTLIQAGGDVDNIGSKTDNSTNYGARIEGDVNILGAVTDAFNTINNIDTSSPEKASLQALLKTLHAETSKLIEALPDKDDAERAARNLRNLTEAATAKKPDPKWFEVSAEGLLEAAKAVAALTAPVTTAVKAVLGFFAK